MYEWIKGSVFNMITTLYPTNITLNSSAATVFNDVRWVMLGLDRNECKLAIKPVAKREVDLKLVPMEQLHKISIGKGYARISCKNIIDEINSLLGKTLDGEKMTTEYNEAENMLIVNLNKEL